MDQKKDQLDAGLRSLDHYQQRLPKWRYRPRQQLLPIVRLETPYLAWFQEKMRSPVLDSYFAMTANLGTHTFFMIILPILFWCGWTNLGRGMVHVLASGVFFSGFIKDLLCLPRPLSPPLVRITMSGSAALEYGFPSTHSTNAVSVAVYAIFALNSSDSTVSPLTSMLLQSLAYAYAASIVIGRLYCGMHGFFDVVIGTILGALLSVVQCVYGEAFDNFMYSGTEKAIVLVILTILVLVRIHPEPADDCPCFDDSVAFAGVFIGVEVGNWHYAKTGHGWSSPSPATIPFSLEELGWFRTILRILLGVVVIFAWREVMKPTLLRYLPPVFRVIERLGLSLPRKFFIHATEYKKVPKHLKDDNVIPSVSEFPSILTSIRHPRRRAVSIGPQSEADAYETLAYREKRRRESISNGHAVSPTSPVGDGSNDGQSPYLFSGNPPSQNASPPSSPTLASKLDVYEHMMGTGADAITLNSNGGESGARMDKNGDEAVPEQQLQERDEKEMFAKIQKPRVRYDVEVVTKLIVYSGIAWISVEGNPLLFDLVGLGLGPLSRGRP